MNRFMRYCPPSQFYNPYRRNNFYQQYHQPVQKDLSSISGKIEDIHESERTDKSKSSDDFLFDLFGIKLYFDDVLILSLLFFLYKEEVKDEGIFLALLLLLIS